MPGDGERFKCRCGEASGRVDGLSCWSSLKVDKGTGRLTPQHRAGQCAGTCPSLAHRRCDHCRLGVKDRTAFTWVSEWACTVA